MRRRVELTAILVFLMMAVFTQVCFAAPRIDLAEDVSVEIQYEKEGVPLSDVTFSIYRIADVSPYVEFTPYGEFAKYNVNMIDLDSEGWRDLAHTLDGYVARDGIMPDSTGITDAQGRLTFAGNDLKTGLYLVIGEKCTKGNTLYTPEPFIVCLPERNQEDKWEYDTVVKPKASAETAPGYDLDLSAIKVWKDNDASKRPDSIEVQLVRDGEVVETVTLDKSNDWKHTWRNLERAGNWKVVEKTSLKGYKVTSVRESDTFVITNTLDKGDGGGKLPQTGVLWWPCLVLLAAGIFCLIAGIYRKCSHGKGIR